jgi:hypothetical protein
MTSNVVDLVPRSEYEREKSRIGFNDAPLLLQSRLANPSTLLLAYE